MSMKKKQVFLPAELIDMLSEVVRSEGYVALQPLFSDHQPGLTHVHKLNMPMHSNR